jgi:hypothetical protein
MATDIRTMIERAASLYILQPPSETEINAYVARIETGSLSLTSAIEEISQIANRHEAANPIGRMFFLLFERAPDPVLFSAAMSALRTGSSLTDIAELGLLYSGLGSPESSTLTNLEFVNLLTDRIWTFPPNGFDPTVFSAMLDAGIMTRAELVAAAAQYTDPTVRYTADLETALIYMVAADRQATRAELTEAASMTTLNLIRDVLVQAGEDPFVGKPYWVVAGNTLLAQGMHSTDLIIDASNKQATLGGDGNFKIVYSQDGGASESSITFRSSLLDTVTRLDARAMDPSTTGATTLKGATTIFAAPTATTIEGTSGNDSLFGNSGNDTISGGSGGIDTLTGGMGNDIFQLQTVSGYLNGGFTTVTDFGRGADSLDFSRLFGNLEPEAITPISGTSDPNSTSFAPLATMTRENVIVIEYNGVWPTDDPDAPAVSGGTLLARTQAQIADLFANVTFDETPSRGTRHVLITTDPTNGADIWLIQNLTALATIEFAEIRKIGHIDTDSPDLYSLLIAEGALIA